ncbi:MAG: hypothetical protein Q4C81_01000 [Kocuria sp.]|nr:hypothetical protein [Kocuria sp.]
MASFVRGISLSLAAVIAGIVVTAFPPTDVPDTATSFTDFWNFLAYVWFGLGAVLLVAYSMSAAARLSMNIPLAIALLVGSAVSFNTATLAHRTGGTAPMLAASAWLLLFVVVGGVELVQRSRRQQASKTT